MKTLIERYIVNSIKNQAQRPFYGITADDIDQSAKLCQFRIRKM